MCKYVVPGGLPSNAPPNTSKMLPALSVEQRYGRSHHHPLPAQWQLGFTFTSAELSAAGSNEHE